jgi:hypothetical protein
MQSVQAVVAERLLKEVDNLLLKSSPVYRWAGQTPSTGWDCSGLTGWLLNRAGIQVPDLTANGFYSRCLAKPDLKWGNNLAPMLALAFQVSGGIANHVGYVLHDFGYRKAILNSTTSLFNNDIGFNMLEWWQDNVQYSAYGNIEKRFLSGDQLAEIVRGLKKWLVHQYVPEIHDPVSQYGEVSFFQETTSNLQHAETVNDLGIDMPFIGDLTSWGVAVRKLGIEPGSVRVYWLDKPGQEDEEVLVAIDTDDGDGTGHISQVDVPPVDDHDWSGTITYGGTLGTPGGISVVHTSVSDSDTRTFKVEWNVTEPLVNPFYGFNAEGILEYNSDPDYNGAVTSQVRRSAVGEEYNSMIYAASLFSLLMSLTYYSDYDPIDTTLGTNFINLSRLTLWLNGLFDPATENPDKGIEDFAEYLEGGYKNNDAYLLTDRVQKLWFNSLGVQMTQGVGVEYRSDWTIRYLPRGKHGGYEFDFNDYAKTLIELRNPTQSAMR